MWRLKIREVGVLSFSLIEVIYRNIRFGKSELILTSLSLQCSKVQCHIIFHVMYFVNHLLQVITQEKVY